MNILLKAAFRAKRHYFILIFTFTSLFALTISNQMEMFALGILSNSGADAFTLFSSKQEKTPEKLSLEAVKTHWSEIDKDQKGYITKQDAFTYLGQKKTGNPLNVILAKIKTFFPQSFLSIIVLLVIIASFKAICLFTSRFTTQLLAIRISHDLRQQYFEHIQHLPMSFFQKYNLGSLSSRVGGDSSQIATSINSMITNYFQTPFTICTTLGMCFYLTWKLSFIIFFGIPLIIFPIVLLTQKVRRTTRQWQKNQERFTSVLIDFLAGIQTVKIFAMEAFSFKKYEEQNYQMAKLEIKAAKYDLLTRPILHTVTTICLAFVAVFGLYILKMPISELIVFCGLLYVLYEPVKKFAEENANVQKGVVAAERLFEVLNLRPQIEDKVGAIPITEFNEKIEFDHVWFRYEEDRWVLKDLSFTVHKGETLAIVGATGAGKSTIVQLLPRLYDVQKGEIRIDGKPISEYMQSSLRKLIAFVPQKPFLFYDTIAANIAVGRPFSLEGIIEAAKKAHAHEFICRMPETYECLLAETGKNLSGGQQQRLAIARALLGKSPLLILDEATSSLDSISEKNIKEAIQELHGSITQIIIAHRLSTIEHADRIIFLEHGEKLAEGTKEELLKSCPPFKIMWETHFASQKKHSKHILEELKPDVLVN